MKNNLHIVHLEDNQLDTDLVRAELESHHLQCSITRVQDRDSFLSALEIERADIVFADSNLPSFDGRTALALVREKFPETPFIIVSGCSNQETVIDLLKSGAMDYVPKNQLPRLVPAVKRALQEAGDRAQRRRLEEQVADTQKMEIFGLLAASLAQDFNNVLAVVMSYSDLLLQECASDGQREFTETIRNAASRALVLTRQLFIFSRKQPLHPLVFDLNQKIEDISKMLRRLLGDNIELLIVPGRNIGRAKADPSRVWQVVLALAINAREAMPEGGKLAIATANATLLAEEARALGLPAGNYLLLTISDTRSGIAGQLNDTFFEPSRSQSSLAATGLDIAACQDLVKQWGGHIALSAQPGNGLAFKIYFPRVNSPVESSETTSAKKTVPRGTETLLVVEDDSEVRDLASALLRAQGYEVYCAPNGQAGLDIILQRTDPPIQLVITDVIMPQMNGKEMTEALKTTHPSLKILFTSGYPEDALQRRGIVKRNIAFLPKPFTPATLAQKVRETLDGTSSPADQETP